MNIKFETIVEKKVEKGTNKFKTLKIIRIHLVQMLRKSKRSRQ